MGRVGEAEGWSVDNLGELFPNLIDYKVFKNTDLWASVDGLWGPWRDPGLPVSFH